MEKHSEKIYDVIVIGSGASGMMAAIAAAGEGADVLVLEGRDRAGIKLLRTGNGKCNYSNYDIGIKDYYFEHKEYIKTVFSKFGQEDTVRFFETIGIFPLERKGYLYPHSETAASLRQALVRCVQDSGADLLTDIKVHTLIKNKNNTFTVNGKYVGKTVILAAGSKAAPDTGSDGTGYQLAKSMGHHIIKPLPALVQLTADKKKCRTAAGVRSTGIVTIETEQDKNRKNEKNIKNNSINIRNTYSEKGEIQYTEYGISGIPVFQLSRYAVKTLDLGGKVYAHIDMIPDCSADKIQDYIKSQHTGIKSMEELFSGILNRKLVRTVCLDMNIDPDAAYTDRDYKKACRILEHMKNYSLEITGFKSFDSAQVCQGGVDTDETDPHTMESRITKGLYFAGEIMDVDGKCGGYNLQWAWSSGYVAGFSAAH